MNRSTDPAAAGSLAQRLLEHANSSWNRALGVRFIQQATVGSLPDDVFARYLILEDGFVETSARARAAAILHATTTRAIHGHLDALNSLITDQHEYLWRALQRVDPSATIAPRARRQADRLSNRMGEISRSCSYPEIIAAMLAAEQLYKAWCSHAMTIPARRHPALDEWLTAHARPPFTQQVAFLVDEIDSLGATCTDARFAQLGSLLAEILDLESAFHDAAYLTE